MFFNLPFKEIKDLTVQIDYLFEVPSKEWEMFQPWKVHIKSGWKLVHMDEEVLKILLQF